MNDTLPSVQKRSTKAAAEAGQGGQKKMVPPPCGGNGDGDDIIDVDVSPPGKTCCMCLPPTDSCIVDPAIQEVTTAKGLALHEPVHALHEPDQRQGKDDKKQKRQTKKRSKKRKRGSHSTSDSDSESESESEESDTDPDSEDSDSESDSDDSGSDSDQRKKKKMKKNKKKKKKKAIKHSKKSKKKKKKKSSKKKNTEAEVSHLHVGDMEQQLTCPQVHPFQQFFHMPPPLPPPQYTPYPMGMQHASSMPTILMQAPMHLQRDQGHGGHGCYGTLQLAQDNFVHYMAPRK